MTSLASAKEDKVKVVGDIYNKNAELEIETSGTVHRKQQLKVHGNFLLEAAPGCHIIHDNKPPKWIVGIDPFVPEDFGLSIDNEDQMPDISIDPDSGLLTCINRHNSNIRTFYISVSCNSYDKNFHLLERGQARDAKGRLFECVTFVIVLEPRKLIDVCYLEPSTTSTCDNSDSDDIVQSNKYNLYSDIQDIPLLQYKSPLLNHLDSNMTKILENMTDKEKYCNYTFPFKVNVQSSNGNKQNRAKTNQSIQMTLSGKINLSSTTPILCSQGFCGCFTHFFKATLHAIDLECPVDTPVLAISDGVVVEIKQDNIVGGIHASNLYKWNSIMLKLDDGRFVEYVHIKANSVLVHVGDVVKRGQHICSSGDVGFCPRPHLHIQMHNTDAKDAPTIPFGFKRYAPDTKDSNIILDQGDVYFIPEAGQYYTENGLCRV